MADYNSFQESFSTFILSASGFRKVFAAENGKFASEESCSTEITPEDSTASAIIAAEFGALIDERGGKTIAVGMDARPTGTCYSCCDDKDFRGAGFQNPLRRDFCSA